MKYTLEQTQYMLDKIKTKTVTYMLDHLDSYGNLYEESTVHIHNLSLEVADLFSEAYRENASEDMLVLLKAYRDLRRGLPIGDDGKRYGASEAYEAMHGV